ncbi:MAG: hypothetical protein AAF938_10200 [Myxococcota bacterium]
MGLWIQLEFMPADADWQPDAELPLRVDALIRETFDSFSGRLRERLSSCDPVDFSPPTSILSNPPANYTVGWDVCPLDVEPPEDEDDVLRKLRPAWTQRVESQMDALDDADDADAGAGNSPLRTLLGISFSDHLCSASDELLYVELVAGTDYLVAFGMGDEVIERTATGVNPLPNVGEISTTRPSITRPAKWGTELGRERPFQPGWTEGVFRARLHFVIRDELYHDLLEQGPPAPSKEFCERLSEVFQTPIAYNWEIDF